MKKLFTIFSVVLLAASVSSCKFVRINMPKGVVVGGENEVSKSYEFDQLNALDIRVPADIHYTQNEDAPVVHILGSEEAVEALDVCVEDGVLVIDSEKALLNSRLDIVINSSDLKSVTISGAGDFEALSGICTDSFSVDVKGAADILLNGVTAESVSLTVKGAGDLNVNSVECQNLSILIQGAGDITVTGKTDKADMLIQGAGDIDAYGLKFNTINKAVQGTGNIGIM